MNNEDIEALAKKNHYVNQLITLKSIWGIETKMGCVVFYDDLLKLDPSLPESLGVAKGGFKTIHCLTVSDLIRIGWCEDASLAVIDDHIGNLKVLYQKDMHHSISDKEYQVKFGTHGNVTFYSSHDHTAIKQCSTILKEVNETDSSFTLYEGCRLVHNSDPATSRAIFC